MDILKDNEPFEDKLRYKALWDKLATQLNITQLPVAVKFFYTQQELDYFKLGNTFEEITEPCSFCALETQARVDNTTYYASKSAVDCNMAKLFFNWQNELDTPSTDTPLEKLSPSVFGLSVAPLNTARFIADTINFSCSYDVAKKLAHFWQEAAGVAPLEPTGINESSCSLSVITHNTNLATLGGRCNNRAVIDQGDGITNIVLPADHFRATIDQMEAGNISLKGSSFNRPGDGFFKIDIH